MDSSKSMKLSKIEVGIPFGLGKVEWIPDQSQKNAAWELYVEFVTRIATQELDLEDGIVREALNSLYSLFEITRSILRNAGPGVGASKKSVGGIAIYVLNNGIRPFLSKWHPKLLNWENQRSTDKSPKAHEREWENDGKIRGELEALRTNLLKYTNELGVIAGVRDY